MVPSEMALLARRPTKGGEATIKDDGDNDDEDDVQNGGVSNRTVKALRLLHLARRVEKELVCYDRSGWLEEPARTLSRLELRPSKDNGPILICLDTSYSMAGEAESVAKALTLACASKAHSSRRQCYLYAFSDRQCTSLQRLEVSRISAFLTYICLPSLLPPCFLSRRGARSELQGAWHPPSTRFSQPIFPWWD
jgi:hypothetical protein